MNNLIDMQSVKEFKKYKLFNEAKINIVLFNILKLYDILTMPI